MQTIEYDLPIFEDTDVADLNKYSAQMAKALKGQLDKFGNPLVFKGGVNSIEELPTTAESGEIYNVIDVNKNYIWNGTEWVIYSDNNQVPAVIDNLESTSTTDALSANQGRQLKTAIEDSKKTKYFNGATTSINTLNINGKWRGYVPTGSEDAQFLGFAGNLIVETFMQSDTNPCLQRITQMASGRTVIRYCTTNAFSYADTLFEASQTGKNIITASLHASKTVPAEEQNVYTICPVVLDNRAGAKLSVTTDGGIKIGKGISKVLVSSRIAIKANNELADRHLRLIKGASNAQENTIAWTFGGIDAGFRGNLYIIPTLVPVSENDVIYMYYYCREGDVVEGNSFGARTSITVEVVE